jgi:hypothetical protein
VSRRGTSRGRSGAGRNGEEGRHLRPSSRCVLDSPWRAEPQSRCSSCRTSTGATSNPEWPSVPSSSGTSLNGFYWWRAPYVQGWNLLSLNIGESAQHRQRFRRHQGPRLRRHQRERPSVPSSSGSPLNDTLNVQTFDPDLLSPHHRGVRSTCGVGSRGRHVHGLPFCPLIIGESAQRALVLAATLAACGGNSHSENPDLPPSVPSSSGSPLNPDELGGSGSCGCRPSVPSSSGSPLNPPRQPTTIRSRTLLSPHHRGVRSTWAAIHLFIALVHFCPLIIGESAQQRPLERERWRGFSGVV